MARRKKKTLLDEIRGMPGEPVRRRWLDVLRDRDAELAKQVEAVLRDYAQRGVSHQKFGGSRLKLTKYITRKTMHILEPPSNDVVGGMLRKYS